MLASGRHSGWSWPLQGAVHPDSCGCSQCLWESRAHALRGLHFCIMYTFLLYAQFDFRVYVFVHAPRACSALCNLIFLPPITQSDATRRCYQSATGIISPTYTQHSTFFKCLATSALVAKRCFQGSLLLARVAFERFLLFNSPRVLNCGAATLSYTDHREYVEASVPVDLEYECYLKRPTSFHRRTSNAPFILVCSITHLDPIFDSQCLLSRLPA